MPTASFCYILSLNSSVKSGRFKAMFPVSFCLFVAFFIPESFGFSTSDFKEEIVQQEVMNDLTTATYAIGYGEDGIFKLVKPMVQLMDRLFQTAGIRLDIFRQGLL